MLSSAAAAQGRGLFISVPQGSLSVSTPQQAEGLRRLQQQTTTVSLQLVRIDLTALNSDVVSMQLADAGELQANRRSKVVRSATDYTWVGDLQQRPGQAVLTVQDGDITGLIVTGFDKYTITPLGGGLHALIKLDPSRFPRDHMTPPPVTPGRGQHAPPPSNEEEAAADPVQVDVLVAYTPAARTAAGGASNMRGLIQSAIDVTNVAYANSNANMMLRLVGTMEVAYTETSFDQSLDDLTEGNIAQVHTQRNALGADLVALLIDNPAACGLGWLNSDADHAFTVTQYSCAVGNFTFAHEIGHNIGARHDPFVDPTNTPFAYGHGYVKMAAPAWRTVMAYIDQCGTCPRLQYFSNPNVQYDGVPMGTTATHDVARVHRQRVATVAAFRSTVQIATNNNFADSILLPGFAGTTTGTNVGASKEAGEPNHAGNAGGRSVWWRFTAPAAGQISLSTTGSNLDTLLAVYTGSAVNNLSLVAFNDDAPGGVTSALVFTATAGVTYHIAVDGFNADTGSVSLNWTISPILMVSPGQGFSSSGMPGGPFSPSSSTYTLRNAGSGMLNYGVGANQSWVSVSQGSGALSSGGSATVTISINSNANALPQGQHTAILNFLNSTNGQGNQTRTVTLQVGAPQPTCTLGASPATVTQGQSTTLSWTTEQATSGSIDNGVGAMTPIAAGWRTVSPATTTTYTATVSSPSGSSTCTATVTVIVGSGELQVTPETPIVATSSLDGPILPSSFTYTLGTASGSTNFTVTDVPSWLVPSTTSGTANTSGTPVTFTLHPDIGTLPVGTYSGTIGFNAGSGAGSRTRSATLTIRRCSPRLGDLDANLRNDLVVRRNDGVLSVVFMNGAQVAAMQTVGQIGTEWMLVGIFDLNGNGRADLLMRRADGTMAVFLMNGAAVQAAQVIGNVGTEWKVAGGGDFNGDGRADILTRRTDGLLGVYLMNGFQLLAGQVLGHVGLEWRIVGIADFDGNGRADFMTRRADGMLAVYFLNPSGLQVASGTIVGQVGTEWRPVGIGDFNGDGKADLLTRRTDGSVAMYLLNAGQVTEAQVLGNIGTEWSLAGVGDLDASNRADLVFRRGDGTLATYLMNGFQITTAAIAGNIAPEWDTCYGQGG